jgi:hypothetical protein
VDRSCDDFLAGAALAGDQHGRVGGRNPIGQRPKFDYRYMFAYEISLGWRPQIHISLGFRRDHCLPIPH